MASAAAAAESALNASHSREAELEAELNASRAAEARSERAKDALDWKLRKTTAIMDAFESLLPGADNASATPNASNVSEPMTNASDTSFLNSTAPSSDAACKSSCDMSGTWVDGTGAEIGLVTDAANPCAGAHDGGAWTYTVTESASGTTITLSDGTVGTIGGSAPARTITWSNGITYTEQSDDRNGHGRGEPLRRRRRERRLDVHSEGEPGRQEGHAQRWHRRHRRGQRASSHHHLEQRHHLHRGDECGGFDRVARVVRRGYSVERFVSTSTAGTAPAVGERALGSGEGRSGRGAQRAGGRAGARRYSRVGARGEGRRYRGLGGGCPKRHVHLRSDRRQRVDGSRGRGSVDGRVDGSRGRGSVAGSRERNGVSGGSDRTGVNGSRERNGVNGSRECAARRLREPVERIRSRGSPGEGRRNPRARGQRRVAPANGGLRGPCRAARAARGRADPRVPGGSALAERRSRRG